MDRIDLIRSQLTSRKLANKEATPAGNSDITITDNRTGKVFI